MAGGVLLSLCIIASTAYDAWQLHQHIATTSERELGNLAESLASGTATSIQAVDLLLRDTATWYESEGRVLGRDVIEPALASRVVGVSQVDVLVVTDARGRQLYRSRQTGVPLADISDRPYFRQQASNPGAGLVLSEPVIARTTGAPALVLSRRLQRADGSFDGVITALLSLRDLQHAYSAIKPGPRSAMYLAMSDGTLVVRQPPLPGGPQPARVPEFVAPRGGPLVERARSQMDGRTKLVAALPVGDRPLILAVTRDEHDSLDAWYEETRNAGIRTALLVVLVLLTTNVLLRQLRRLDQGALALSESEQRYAMAMEAAEEGHAEWNIESGRVFLSNRWRLLHGLDTRTRITTVEEVRAAVMVHPEDADRLHGEVDRHLGGATAMLDVEYRVRQQDGNWQWVHARGRCVRQGADSPSRLYWAVNEIGTRKAAEEAKLALDARLAQARRLEALGTLAGGIAHDFNNILGAILGFGEMAQQSAKEGSGQRRHIDRVLQAGERAKLLVQRILDFSRSGVTDRSPIEVQAVTEEAIAMLGGALPPGITLTGDLDGGGATVLANATQIHQVVVNLCTNAIHATGGGEVRVRLRRVHDAQPVEAIQGSIPAGDHVRLDVVDHGAGMTRELLARIFEPFFTTKKPGEGTGLGLSVVHGIVSDLGGCIDVASVVDEGTCVSVWLPVGGDVAPAALMEQDPVLTGKGQVVLVVDDERALMELAEELLAELGYAPIPFDDPTAALDAFLADPDNIDVLVTDETMPGMTGSELVRRMRERRPDLPVLVMSGHIDQHLEAALRAAGDSALLRKPFAAAELGLALSRCLAGAARTTGSSPPRT